MSTRITEPRVLYLLLQLIILEFLSPFLRHPSSSTSFSYFSPPSSFGFLFFIFPFHLLSPPFSFSLPLQLNLLYFVFLILPCFLISFLSSLFYFFTSFSPLPPSSFSTLLLYFLLFIRPSSFIFSSFYSSLLLLLPLLHPSSASPFNFTFIFLVQPLLSHHPFLFNFLFFISFLSFSLLPPPPSSNYLPVLPVPHSILFNSPFLLLHNNFTWVNRFAITLYFRS
jgi:hypothetical protein